MASSPLGYGLGPQIFLDFSCFTSRNAFFLKKCDKCLAIYFEKDETENLSLRQDDEDVNKRIKQKTYLNKLF